jgi:hypothetical protein
MIVERVSWRRCVCDIPLTVFARIFMARAVDAARAAIILVCSMKLRCLSRWNPNHRRVFGAMMGRMPGSRRGGDELSGPLVKCMSSTFSACTCRPLSVSHLVRTVKAFWSLVTFVSRDLEVVRRAPSSM